MLGGVDILDALGVDDGLRQPAHGGVFAEDVTGAAHLLPDGGQEPGLAEGSLFGAANPTDFASDDAGSGVATGVDAPPSHASGLAIEEFEEQSERARYLEAQHADLSAALDTLEKAIRKIDRETRQRFQEVFDAVNTGLKRLFPRLFGGGHAYLSLEGDDLLNAGVTIMAQPPGKRNTSIHLLSGGEKALTAVALVFSIFELNPAPFCLLDEVDAPLDDANVGRFCDIVREMSGNVQFLFITHNKVTMELASQLMGVTMGEPGVSRLVSVDIDEAVKLAG